MNHFVKITALLSFVLITASSQCTYAQETTFSNDFARNSVFLELGGNGLLYSLNYDHKFFDHASARIGAMFISVSANDPTTVDGRVSVFLLPLMANYLVGDGNSRLELGGGLLVGGVNADATIDNEAIDDVAGGAAFTANVGYRLQPRDGGFLFRIGFTPVISSAGFLPWAGISFGATF
ncbi:MAG: hypothetical protein WA958_10765 [Tunicatimonas sp.]